jgi:hypothetical protein
MKHFRMTLVLFSSAVFMLGRSQPTSNKASDDAKAVSDATKKTASDAVDASKKGADGALQGTK